MRLYDRRARREWQKDGLTQLERNALQWVLLCARFGLDSKTTSIFEFVMEGGV